MRIKPWGLLKLIRLNLRITSHLAENIQRPHVSRVNCCKKSLKLSHSALLKLDNTFNSFNFAFSVATIIAHFFDLGTFLNAKPEVHLSGEFDFVTPRIFEFAPVGSLGSGSEE